ncbi:2537_t:CDS:2 [Acaulospora colombiana]|uniref:2537_t:CDS:1 n=1 Tax=Acaulospora colombiana TaxID=27376 RepID=A0ACA9L2S9_9GLOM|nr:2537_t:CDS:2 [Acaulospora colombiana]
MEQETCIISTRRQSYKRPKTQSRLKGKGTASTPTNSVHLSIAMRIPQEKMEQENCIISTRRQNYKRPKIQSRLKGKGPASTPINSVYLPIAMRIPQEILCNIFNYLVDHPVHYTRVARVCKSWQLAADSHLYWRHLVTKLNLTPPKPRARKYKTYKQVVERDWNSFCSLCFRGRHNGFERLSIRPVTTDLSSIAEIYRDTKTNWFQIFDEDGLEFQVSFKTELSGLEIFEVISDDPTTSVTSIIAKTRQGDDRIDSPLVIPEESGVLSEFGFNINFVDSVTCGFAIPVFQNPKDTCYSPRCSAIMGIFFQTIVTLRVLEEDPPEESDDEDDDMRFIRRYILRFDRYDDYYDHDGISIRDLATYISPYRIDADRGKRLALREWVDERFKKGITTSPRNDPDTQERPPKTLWAEIDSIIDERRLYVSADDRNEEFEAESSSMAQQRQFD